MGQVTTFSRMERRRRWGAADKRALVEAAFAPGAVVSEVARPADVAASQIDRWRKQFEAERVGDFAALIVAPGQAGGTTSVRPPPAAAVVIEIGGAVVRIAADAPPRLMTHRECLALIVARGAPINIGPDDGSHFIATAVPRYPRTTA